MNTLGSPRTEQASEALAHVPQAGQGDQPLRRRWLQLFDEGPAVIENLENFDLIIDRDRELVVHGGQERTADLLGSSEVTNSQGQRADADGFIRKRVMAGLTSVGICKGVGNSISTGLTGLGRRGCCERRPTSKQAGLRLINRCVTTRCSHRRCTRITAIAAQPRVNGCREVGV